MVEKYSDDEIDLIGRCISVACWNKRLERYCGKGGDEGKAKVCLFIVRSILSDMKNVIQNQLKEGKNE